MYFADTLAAGPRPVHLILSALLLSNFRATWIAAKWTPGSEEATPPPRWGDSWTDKFGDKLPVWLWPKVRYIYYVLSVCYFALLAIGLAVLVRRYFAAPTDL